MKWRSTLLELSGAVRHDVVNDSSPDAQARLSIETTEALLEVFRFERQVAIQLDDKIKITAAQRSVAFIERLHHTTAVAPKTPVRPVHGSHPRNLARTLFNDPRRSVSRAVVYNHPLRWNNTLASHAIDGEPQVCLFIANGRDDNVPSVHWKSPIIKPRSLGLDSARTASGECKPASQSRPSGSDSRTASYLKSLSSTLRGAF